MVGKNAIHASEIVSERAATRKGDKEKYYSSWQICVNRTYRLHRKEKRFAVRVEIIELLKGVLCSTSCATNVKNSRQSALNHHVRYETARIVTSRGFMFSLTSCYKSQRDLVGGFSLDFGVFK